MNMSYDEMNQICWHENDKWRVYLGIMLYENYAVLQIVQIFCCNIQPLALGLF